MRFQPYLDKLNEPEIRPYAITGGTVLLALLLCWGLWWHYFRSPWTRDGRVRAEVVNIAAEISGKVIKLKVEDNQPVRKGDVLFEIDPVDYQLALAQAEATLEGRQSDLKIAGENSQRRISLGKEVISTEEINNSQNSTLVAQAAFQSALAARDKAKVDLERTVVRSPVNGYVTNLILRVGDYASPGQAKVTLVDSDSFWVAGYFEETKLPRIHEGDFARIELMGWGPAIKGHVKSISNAIADTNSDANSVGLANVSPIFTWVRLAQRIPVRIQIDEVPNQVRIAAGQTCTIVISPGKK